MGFEEWRIPVGRAETTRKGEREEKGAADGDHGNTTRKRERGEEGRERRDQDQGRYNAQKMGGEGIPIYVGTGGVRGSDERGDRTAEKRQKRVQNEGNGTDEERQESRQRQRRREDRNCSVRKEAKEILRPP